MTTRADIKFYKKLAKTEEYRKWEKFKKCPMCGGKKREPKYLGGNPYTDLFAGDFCPHEFHGPLPGYNCF